MSKRYKPKPARPETVRLDETVEVRDPRFNIDIDTVGKLRTLRLTSTITPVLTIPATIDPTRRAIIPMEAGQAIEVSRVQGRFYGASLPSETIPGFYDIACDASHRLYVIDDQALSRLVSILNSIGDAGTNPTNTTGATLLNRTANIQNALTNPSNAETFTTTPLGANATYTGPSRDFQTSRLAAFGVMGYADQPSATDGVYIQLSHDGSNWDYRGATATLSAAGAVSLCQVVTARYARAVWVNGSTAQTAFRFGGRYMIAGSENPPVSPVIDYPMILICVDCGDDRTETGDAFAEKKDGKWIVWCPKCYAIKREREMKDTTAWKRSWQAWFKTDPEHAKEHAPDEWSA